MRDSCGGLGVSPKVSFPPFPSGKVASKIKRVQGTSVPAGGIPQIHFFPLPFREEGQGVGSWGMNGDEGHA